MISIDQLEVRDLTSQFQLGSYHLLLCLKANRLATFSGQRRMSNIGAAQLAPWSAQHTAAGRPAAL